MRRANLALLLMIGCGGTDGYKGRPDSRPQDGGEPSDTRRSTDVASTARLGLESRPTNRTCSAPTRPTTTSPDTVPQSLRATGCVDPSDPKKPAEGLIPYGVNSPLWSDGADKQRFLALPEGKKITVRPDGDWDLPVGSVVVKSFALEGKFIETRLLVRHTDGDWAGYTYEWNDAQTDATLMGSGSKTKKVGKVEWFIPGREDCLTCHTTAAGRTLGLESAELDGEFRYTNGRIGDQLPTLSHIGVLETPIQRSTAPLPTPTGSSGSLAERARSYLHANCAGCHRPSGVKEVDFDLRYGVSLAEMKICDVRVEKGEFGIEGVKRLVPGDPDRSMISLRMHSLEPKVRMPQLGTTVVDEKGVLVIEEWIRSLPSCTSSN